jgi:cytochrome P450
MTTDLVAGLPRGPSGAATLWAGLRGLADHTSLLRGWEDAYGDPFTMKTPMGAMVLTSDPEAVKSIYTAHPDTFLASFPQALDPLIGQSSLLLMSGAPHRAARKILLPPFHGARMRAYGSLMRDATLRWAAKLEPGKRFSVEETAQGISLEVILRAVFGARGVEATERLRQAIRAMIGAFTPAVAAVKALRRRFGGIGPWARFLRARAEVEEIVFAEIAACRGDGAAREDILALLVQARHEDGSELDEREILDHLVTMVVAGHETTATALAWACYGLHRHPETLARLREEVAAAGPEPDALAKVPYLDAVQQEALRLWPMSIALSRKLARPFELRGFELPKGTLVAVSALLHFREELFPEPHRFRPERFLERTYTPFEFVPFGGGARRCIGAAFASYEMKIVLGTLLAHYELALASEKAPRPVVRPGTIGPEGGVPMIMVGPRRAS